MNDQTLVALGRQFVNDAIEKESMIRRMMDLEKEIAALKAAAPKPTEATKPSTDPKKNASPPAVN